MPPPQMMTCSCRAIPRAIQSDAPRFCALPTNKARRYLAIEQVMDGFSMDYGSLPPRGWWADEVISCEPRCRTALKAVKQVKAVSQGRMDYRLRHLCRLGSAEGANKRPR